MLELPWLIAEGAALAAPASAAALAWRGRRRLRGLWRAPILYAHGRPVSLVTLYAELNGETELCDALRELVGGSGPLSAKELQRAVRLLQASPVAWRRLVLDQAVEAAVRGGEEDLRLMDTLEAELDALGFFEFMRGLARRRTAAAAPLLPVEGMLAGGMPELPATEAPPPAEGQSPGMFGVLEAIGLFERVGWLPSVASAAASLLKDWQLKRAQETAQRALGALGQAVSKALRARAPAGEGVRHNVYRALDAYQTLETRLAARRARGLARWAPSVEEALLAEYAASLARARALVADKCAGLERTLSGKFGALAAGETLFRHREALLAGVAPDAFPLAPVEAAYAELRRMTEQAER